MSRKIAAICLCILSAPGSYAQKKGKLNLSLDGIWSGYFDEKKKQTQTSILRVLNGSLIIKQYLYNA